MCEFSGNLIAWLDGELPPAEVERVRGHLEACSECRLSLEGYRQVTFEFNAFCNKRLGSTTQRRGQSWTAVVTAAGAIAAIVAVLLIASRPHAVRYPAFRPQESVASAPSASTESLPLPVRRVERAQRKQKIVAAP